MWGVHARGNPSRVGCPGRRPAEFTDITLHDLRARGEFRPDIKSRRSQHHAAGLDLGQIRQIVDKIAQMAPAIMNIAR